MGGVTETSPVLRLDIMGLLEYYKLVYLYLDAKEMRLL